MATVLVKARRQGDKALRIYVDHLRESPSTSAEGESGFTFNASRGWFERFKHRSGILSVAAHPQDLDDDIPEGFCFIKMKFLPPNSTPILQTMDQQVISNVKTFYARALCQKCFEVINDTQLKRCEFWKDHFTIMNCLTLICNAWTHWHAELWIPHGKTFGQTLYQSKIL